jgi:hypothetical protein
LETNQPAGNAVSAGAESVSASAVVHLLTLLVVAAGSWLAKPRWWPWLLLQAEDKESTAWEDDGIFESSRRWLGDLADGAEERKQPWYDGRIGANMVVIFYFSEQGKVSFQIDCGMAG